MKAAFTSSASGPDSLRQDERVGRRGVSAKARRSSGFALLITITLLAFLVLLLVSLASLTRVETQVASNTQQIAQARQNALLALNIALGQLQKFTGPDQRTTARADMDANLANTTTANGRWLGVYGNGAPVDTNYTLKASEIPTPILAQSDSKGSQARLLNWLVSGNEKTPFDPVPASANVAADGHITTPPASFDYTPASTVNLATAKTLPETTDTQTLLVGSKSAKAISDYVAAPLMNVDATAGAIAGMATGGTVGRYAWWVGDEGAKARANLRIASGAERAAAFVSAQRAGIELVDGKNEVGSTNATDLIGTTAYDAGSNSLKGVFSVSQLSMLSSVAAAELPAALKVRFHDLTTTSKSVLVDVYAGGMKKDLSALLSTNAMDNTPIFPPETWSLTDSLSVPKWGLLRDFVSTTAPTDNSGVAPRLATATKVGIAPVLSYIAYGMQYTAPSGTDDGMPIRCAIFPIVVLWNPYTFPLPTHRYSVGMNRRFYPLYQLQVEVTTDVWEERETIDFGNGGVKYGTPGAKQSYMRFVVDSGVIPPGASVIYTLQGTQSGKDYFSPVNGAPTNVLTPGLNVNGHVLLNYGEAFVNGEGLKNFRVNGDPLLPIAPATVAPQLFGMSGGEACAFLGEEGTIGTTGDVGSYLKGGTNNYQWHQFIAHYTPSADGNSNKGPNGRNAQLQTAARLGPPLQATSVMSAKKAFGKLLESNIYADVRWIAQLNPRAGIITSTPSPSSINAPNQIGEGGREKTWQNFYAVPPGIRANSGMSLDVSTSSPIDATLFEFRPADQPLLSIGQLQHANLSLFHAYPAYVVGNSLADYRFKARDTLSINYPITSGIDNSPNDQMTAYYDMSWMVNRMLWDRYFVSTVPHAGSGKAGETNATNIPATLANPRHERYTSTADQALTQAQRDANLKDTDKAAANLMLAGGFNINSTSEQAWRAVLGGVNQLVYKPEDPSVTGAALKSALSRFSKPTTMPAVDNSQAWGWQGYRQLSEAQIAELAKNVVTEIRNRGPFVSLSDFVNRRLKDNAATTGATANEQFKGTLQAAIDTTYTGTSAPNAGGASDYGTPDTNPFFSRLSSNSMPGFPNLGTGTAATKYSVPGVYDTELMNGFTGTASAPADSNKPYSSTNAFAPQFLTQADVLSTIGSSLSARSDTFTIRTYGETMNPVTKDINGRAWCEAVVQRMPDYVDAVTDSNAAAAPTAAINKSMGRRYKIVSFRWLTSNDI